MSNSEHFSFPDGLRTVELYLGDVRSLKLEEHDRLPLWMDLMNQASQIADWPAELLKAALTDAGELTVELESAVREFVQRIGGQENALLAMDMLVELEGAWNTFEA